MPPSYCKPPSAARTPRAVDLRPAVTNEHAQHVNYPDFRLDRATITMMKLLKRGSRKTTELEGVVGKARHDRDNRSPSKKLRSGDIAIIDHVDLDRAHAEALIRIGVSAVINTSSSTSGRYPNIGPLLLAKAGVVLIDQVGEEAGDAIRNGETLRAHDGIVYRGETVIARGLELDEGRIRQLRESAALDLGTRMEAVAANATDHIRHQSDLAIEGVGTPRLSAQLRDRPMVVVSKSHQVDEDLAGLEDYIKHYEPVLIGAGTGADCLLANGYTPHVVVGGIDELSDRSLRCGGEIVITTSSGLEPAMHRVEKAGASAQIFRGVGSDEDLALMLADSNDASLIVLAGGAPGMMQLLDRGPNDSASTLVTRMRMGSNFVDAKAVGEFYRHKSSLWPVLLLIAVSVLAIVVAVAITPSGGEWASGIGGSLRDVASWVKGWFT